MLSTGSQPTPRRQVALCIALGLVIAVLLPLLGTARAQGAPIPEPACPVEEGTRQQKADSLNLRLRVGGEEVATLQGNVAPGDLVEAEVTVAEGCEVVDLTLASYAASAPSFPSDQRLVASTTQPLLAGTHRLALTAPDGCFQIDLAYGQPILELGPEFYGSRLIDFANGGSAPCGPLPEVPEEVCPPLTGSRAEIARSMDIRVRSAGSEGTRLSQVVQPGEPAAVDLTIPSSCGSIELTLASYTASDRTWPSDQQLYDYETGYFPPGPHTLTVEVPDCFYQVDLAFGPPIPDLTRDRYGERLIDFDNGGEAPCEDTEPGPGETVTVTPTPTPTVPPAETVTATPTPTTVPDETVTATPTTPEDSPTSGGGVLPDRTERPAPTTSPTADVRPLPTIAPDDTGVADDEVTRTPTPTAVADRAAVQRSLARTGLPFGALAALGLLGMGLGLTLLRRLRGRL